MQTPKPILLIPSKDCNSRLRAELREAGYVVISTNNPAGIKLLGCDTQTNDMLMAALKSIAAGPHSSSERTVFVSELYNRLKLREDSKL